MENMKDINREIPKNLIFISGIHGCGKDTLIEDLFADGRINKLPFRLLRYQKCEMTSFDRIFERQVRRIAKYTIDFKRAVRLAVDNPDAIIITDRSILDARTYLEAFKRLNWLAVEETNWLIDILKVSFEPFISCDLITFLLLPPYDFVDNNLNKRQREEGPKWHETDREYCRCVYDIYESVNDVCELTCHETGRKERVDILFDFINKQWDSFVKSGQQEIMKEKNKLERFHPALWR